MNVNDLRTFLSGFDPSDKVELYEEMVVVLQAQVKDLKPVTVVHFWEPGTDAGGALFSFEFPYHIDDTVVSARRDDLMEFDVFTPPLGSIDAVVSLRCPPKVKWVPRG